jgi:hypothetical protein
VFLLGAHFETYEILISLIFQFLGGHGKPWILNQWIWGHNCMPKKANLQKKEHYLLSTVKIFLKNAVSIYETLKENMLCLYECIVD